MAKGYHAIAEWLMGIENEKLTRKNINLNAGRWQGVMNKVYVNSARITIV